MNKYLVLFICFIVSLVLIIDRDNDYIESVSNTESIYVFYDINDEQNDVVNPDTRDISIQVYFVISFYSLIFTFITLNNIKKIDKYVPIKGLVK
ncbi:MAG: hypothetical protein ACI4XM_01505 [Candidatus Coprovivens sp.]